MGPTWKEFTLNGLLIAGIFASSVIVATADMQHLPTRAGLSLLGGLSAYLAVTVDKPKTRQEAAWRAGVGSLSCFLFGPGATAAAGYYVPYFLNPDGWIPIFGVVGLASWYAVGQLTKGLQWLQRSNVAETWGRNKLGPPPENKGDGK